MTEHRITAGFMPLTDSLLLVIAREKGFAAAEGIDLALVRETSWANIRDRIAVGHFDVAHMLAPMPIAASLGLTPIAAPVIAPMALGLGGNAVTVSTALWTSMADAGRAAGFRSGQRSARALAAVVQGRRTASCSFAVVHPHSGHNYELRYWLAASGIQPDRDIEIVILPPPLMADALGGRAASTAIAWASPGTASASHRARAASRRSRPRSGAPARKRCSGVTERWADKNPRSAVGAAARPAMRPRAGAAMATHHAEAAAILRGPHYLGQPAELIVRALSGQIDRGDGAVRFRCRTSSCRTPTARTFPAPATRSGSTARWCAGATSAIARSSAASRLQPIGRTSTAPPLPGSSATGSPCAGNLLRWSRHSMRPHLDQYLADQQRRDLLIP